MEITVQVKNIYGNTLVYPICDKAKLLASLSGHKTLTDHAVDRIKQLGYKIIVQQNVVEL